jgi:DNA-binding SARP family transcriptional activator
VTDLHVFMFGKLQIYFREQALDILSARKVQELFCYLLLHRGRPHPREALASLLWGDGSTTRSKKYLRQALWQLQAELDVYTDSGKGRMLLLEPDWVRLNPQANSWIDVAAFEESFGLMRGIMGRELDAHQAQTLQSAVNLYRGDLLEGWYQDWCLFERERLQNMYLMMLDKLIGYCEAHEDYEAGLEYGTCILRHDGARERTHRRMMRLYYLSGHRTAALRQYERCAAALSEELGVEPSKRTLALLQQIQADRLEDAPAAPVVDVEPGEEKIAALPGILIRFRQVQTALTDAQRMVQGHIHAIEAILDNQQEPLHHS